MSAFVKFQAFIENLGKGVIDLDTDTLKIALSNTAPNAATNSVFADITEISAGSGYTAGGTVVANNVFSQTGGTGKLTGDDVVFTASGGSIGPWRYAILYSDTPTSPADPLIAYWDRGSSATATDPDTITIDLDATNGVLQIA